MGTVGSLMSRTLHRASETTTVAEAATIMARERVGSTLVMDGDRMLGIFTERDIVRAISSSRDSPADPVSHWMTRNPKTLSPSALPEEALKLMVEGNFRHVPVVEHDRLVGMLSMRDLAAAGVEGALPAARPK
jgi:CBS domain-containing protein